MKVLFAIRNERNLINSIARKYQQDTSKKMIYKEVKSFAAIMRELQENNDYDRIIIGDNIENKINQSPKKDVEIKKRITSIYKVAINKKNKKIPIIFLTSDYMGFKYLYELNIFNALTFEDANKENIYKLINVPRTKKGAFEYYKNFGNTEKKVDNMENRESNVNLNKIINYLNRVDLSNDKYVKRFDKIYSELDKKEIGIIVKSLTTNTKRILRKESSNFQNFIADQKNKKNEKNEDEPRRGRGRPRKVQIEETTIVEKEKRGRGRPRKNVEVVEELSEEQSSKSKEKNVKKTAKGQNDDKFKKIENNKSDKINNKKENSKSSKIVESKIEGLKKSKKSNKEENKKETDKKKKEKRNLENDLEKKSSKSSNKNTEKKSEKNNQMKAINKKEKNRTFFNQEDDNLKNDEYDEWDLEDDDKIEINDKNKKVQSKKPDIEKENFEEDEFDLENDDLEKYNEDEFDLEDEDDLDDNEDEFDLEEDDDLDDDEDEFDLEEEDDLEDNEDEFDLEEDDNLDDDEDEFDLEEDDNLDDDEDEFDLEEDDDLDDDEDEFDLEEDDNLDDDEEDFDLEDDDDLDDDEDEFDLEDEDDLEDNEDEFDLEDDDNLEDEEEDFELEDDDNLDDDEDEFDLEDEDDLEDNEDEFDLEDDDNLEDEEEDFDLEDDDNLEDEEEDFELEDDDNLEDDEEDFELEDDDNLEDEEEESDLKDDDDLDDDDDIDLEDDDDLNFETEELDEEDDDLLDLDSDEDEENEDLSDLEEDEDLLDLDTEEDDDEDLSDLDTEEEEKLLNSNEEEENDKELVDLDDDILDLDDGEDEDEDLLNLDSDENDENDDNIINLDDDSDTLNLDEDKLKVKDSVLGLDQTKSQFSGIKNKNYNPNYDLSKQINSINGISMSENQEEKENSTQSAIRPLKIEDGQRVAAFIGAHGNGTSFIINNIAQVLSEQGIKTAILDLTKNKNSYYIYNESEERLRNIAFSCFEKLKSGISDGIKVNKNLAVFTALPYSDEEIDDKEAVLTTLLNNYSLVLIDCDFDTDQEIFELVQDIYLVQSLDILTIQPLTSFLKKLKMNKVLTEDKIKILINKDIRVNSLNERMLISAMSVYNSPDTTYQLDLFNRDKVEFLTIPFEEQNYSKYLDELTKCKLTARGYSKNLRNSFNKLSKMVYPINVGKKGNKSNK